MASRLQTTAGSRRPAGVAAPMLIELVQDRAQWNRAILELGGSLFQSWEWGELRRGAGWIPWRVSLETGGSVQAALQILERRLPLLPVSLMYAPRAILPGKASTEALGDLVQWLRRFLRERRALLLRIDPSVLDGDSARKELLRSVGFRMLPDQWGVWGTLPRTFMVLDVTRPEESLLSGMRRKHRQHIAGAAKKGIQFEAGTGVAHLRDLYRLLLQNAARRGFPLRGFDHFLALRENFFHDNRGRVFLAQRAGRSVAGLLCVRFGDSCYFLHGASDRDVQGAFPNEGLHWEAIRWAKANGCQRCNLLGAGTAYPVSQENSGYGIYRFKEGLGAELHFYAGYSDLVGAPTMYRLFRFTERRLGSRAYRVFVLIQRLVRRG